MKAIPREQQQALYSFLCLILGEESVASQVGQRILIALSLDEQEQGKDEHAALIHFWKTTHELLCEHLKRKREIVVPELISERASPGAVRSSLPSLDSRANEAVAELLKPLSFTQREAVLMRAFSPLDVSGIARALGTSPASIELLLRRARQHLADHVTFSGDVYEALKSKLSRRLPMGFESAFLGQLKREKDALKPKPRRSGRIGFLGACLGLALAGAFTYAAYRIVQYRKLTEPPVSPGASPGATPEARVTGN